MADILILDAMGVLYEAGDDVAELLVPFVGKHGRSDLSAEAIDRDYVEASLGRMGPDAFWRRMEAYKQAFGAGGSTMILSPDTDFFRYFNDPSGPPAAKK